MFHVLLLLACAVAIYLACEWFVNAVEWLGVRLQVGPIAVGTVLAAARHRAAGERRDPRRRRCSAAPEHGNDIGVGAAMGGPLVGRHHRLRRHRRHADWRSAGAVARS